MSQVIEQALTPTFKTAARRYLASDNNRITSLQGVSTEAFSKALKALEINTDSELEDIIHASKTGDAATARRRRLNPSSLKYEEIIRLRERATAMDKEKAAAMEREEDPIKAKELNRKFVAWIEATNCLFFETNLEDVHLAAIEEYQCRWMLEAYSKLESSERMAILQTIHAMLVSKCRFGLNGETGPDSTLMALALKMPDGGFSATSRAELAESGNSDFLNLMNLLERALEPVLSEAPHEGANDDLILRKYSE